MAIEKSAIITPIGCFGCGAKRQKAMKFKLAAANIISMPMRMKIAWRRLNAASRPMENNAAETMRKSWSVAVIVVVRENPQRPAPHVQVPTQNTFEIECGAESVQR